MGCIYTEAKNYPREPAAHVAISEFIFVYSLFTCALKYFLYVNGNILSVNLEAAFATNDFQSSGAFRHPSHFILLCRG
jgi:hypothetical protein